MHFRVEPKLIGVADRDSECVRCVVGLGRSVEVEKNGDHSLHLILVGTAVADDGLFHFERGVLVDRQPALDGGEKCNTSDVSELQCAFDVDGIEDAFDDHLIGAPLVYHVEDSIMDKFQFLGKRKGGASTNDALTHEGMAASVGIDHAKTGNVRARVDPENPHGF